MWRTASTIDPTCKAASLRAAILYQPGGGGRVGVDREQVRAHLIVQVAGEFAALVLLQCQQPLVQTAVLGGGFREPRRHPIETVAQPRQVRRQPAADPDTVMAVADLLQRRGQSVERPQGAADKNIDEQDRETAEHGKCRKALGELVPDFEGLVVRIGLDHDRAVTAVGDGNGDLLGLGRNSDETHKPCRRAAEFRFLDEGCGEGRRLPRVPYPQVTIALEGRHQIVEIARRVSGVLQAVDRALDCLPPDQKGRAHLGTNRARGVGIRGHAGQREADQQHDANQADQTEPKRHEGFCREVASKR